MALKKISFKTFDELKEHIKTHRPTFYYSSMTSTVIPFDKLEQIYQDEDFTLADLSQLPSEMQLNDQGDLTVRGPVSWKEAKEYLRSKGRAIKTAPTENLALISAGAATSATGERCFMYGSFRSQIKRIKYLDYEANERELFSHQKMPVNEKLKEYQEVMKDYTGFKNPPFPRFENETDLMTGTEGQLGVITEIEIETAEDMPVNHLFMLLPKWEEGTSSHIEVCEKIQAFRDDVILCEFIDANSFNYLPHEERPNQEKDAIFFEVIADKFEHFYENFLATLSFLNEDEVFELSESKFHQIRASIPRAVFEENSRQGVTKMGTDVQVRVSQFEELFEIYRNFSRTDVRYNLFGHFGDAHLHFNFMPKKDQTKECQKLFEQMYESVVKMKGSPFAEHGIGIIKQKFIKQYWSEAITDYFKYLKATHDPHNQFFPQGFMNLEI